MENNLKNRYIYAVTRYLPIKTQADVEKELDGLISEMLDERRGNNNTPSEQDLKDVLAELGTPEELALKYGGNERKALISGVYFLIYKRVLCIVLPIVAAVLAVSTSVGFFVGGESTFLTFMGIVNITVMTHVLQIVTVTIGGVVQAFAVITVIFAVMDYMKVDLKDGDFFDLPEIPEAKMKISPLEPIFWIAFSIATTILLLGFPHVIGAHLGGSWITVFSIEIIRGMWLPILIWTLLEVVVEIVKLIEGQYNIRMAVVTVVACVLQMICAVIVFGNSEIINPELINYIEGFGAGVLDIGSWSNNLLIRPHTGIMVVMLGIIIWEIAEVVIKTFQSKKFGAS